MHLEKHYLHIYEKNWWNGFYESENFLLCVCMCVRGVTDVLLYLSSFENVIMHLFQVSIVEE
jgi:hypothetical protein